VLRARRRARLGAIAPRLLAACLAVALLALAFPAAVFGARPAATRVPVLILDAGLGDAPLWISRWLGDGATSEAKAGSTLRLWKAPQARWWGADAPVTYVLASSTETGGPTPGGITVADIAWALDRVNGAPSMKALIVAQGATGLQARAYLQSAGTPAYLGREDVVGLIEVGTPNNGMEMAARYPRVDAWAPIAAGAGLGLADVLPGSAWLSRLHGAKPLPVAMRVGVVQGLPARVAGLESDGFVTRADSRVATGVADEPVYRETRSRASEAWPQTKSWMVMTRRGGATTETLDENPIDQLGFLPGYPKDPEVASAIKRMYETWFTGPMPVTHISTRLVVDSSGSMRAAWSGTTKIDAARQAAAGFAAALQARTSLPGASAEDIGLIAFSTSPAQLLAPTADAARVASLMKGITPSGNTDVGGALAAAIDSFASSPRAADKAILLLSDGLPTAGMDKRTILRGPVAKAKAAGIRVYTVALGGAGQVDAALLKQMAAETGGSFHQSNDLFELRRDFIRARFASLGALQLDKQLAGAGQVPLVKATAATRMIEAAIVPSGRVPNVRVLADGKPVPADAAIVRKAEGVVLVSLRHPVAGSYALEITGLQKGERAQVFAVSDSDVFSEVAPTRQPADNSLLLLAVIGAALVVGVGLTVTLSIRKRALPAAVPSANGVEKGEPPLAEEAK
jgi:hypothetical protein